ncbi:unnamed protein product, partial [Discosporangium mesarthrocarpum]
LGEEENVFAAVGQRRRSRSSNAGGSGEHGQLDEGYESPEGRELCGQGTARAPPLQEGKGEGQWVAGSPSWNVCSEGVPRWRPTDILAREQLQASRPKSESVSRGGSPTQTPARQEVEPQTGRAVDTGPALQRQQARRLEIRQSWASVQPLCREEQGTRTSPRSELCALLSGGMLGASPQTSPWAATRQLERGVQTSPNLQGERGMLTADEGRHTPSPRLLWAERQEAQTSPGGERDESAADLADAATQVSPWPTVNGLGRDPQARSSTPNGVNLAATPVAGGLSRVSPRLPWQEGRGTQTSSAGEAYLTVPAGEGVAADMSPQMSPQGPGRAGQTTPEPKRTRAPTPTPPSLCTGTSPLLHRAEVEGTQVSRILGNSLPGGAGASAGAGVGV